MNVLADFWGVSLLFAGVSFAVITLIVTVRGFVDLRAMIADLKKDLNSTKRADRAEVQQNEE